MGAGVIDRVVIKWMRRGGVGRSMGARPTDSGGRLIDGELAAVAWRDDGATTLDAVGHPLPHDVARGTMPWEVLPVLRDCRPCGVGRRMSVYAAPSWVRFGVAGKCGSWCDCVCGSA